MTKEHLTYQIRMTCLMLGDYKFLPGNKFMTWMSQLNPRYMRQPPPDHEWFLRDGDESMPLYKEIDLNFKFPDGNKIRHEVYTVRGIIRNVRFRTVKLVCGELYSSPYYTSPYYMEISTVDKNSEYKLLTHILRTAEKRIPHRRRKERKAIPHYI